MSTIILDAGFLDIVIPWLLLINLLSVFSVFLISVLYPHYFMPKKYIEKIIADCSMLGSIILLGVHVYRTISLWIKIRHQTDMYHDSIVFFLCSENGGYYMPILIGLASIGVAIVLWRKAEQR